MPQDTSASPRTATAAVTTGHGGPEMIDVRHDWEVPDPRAGQALVRVTAAALNNTDIWSREGAYGSAEDPDAIAGWKGVPLDFPRTQGIDIAGRVASVGGDSDREWVGRRVMVDPALVYQGDFPTDIAGSEADGGFAQFYVANIDQLHDVEGSRLSDAQIACLPTAYGTAMGMINRARCGEGERVLVTGSSGGVGMAAIQLLLARGCRVIAHTSENKARQVLASGVDRVTVRGTSDLAELAEVDAVVDVVGGDEFGQIIDCLKDGGRLVSAGAIGGPVVPFDIRRLYLRQRSLIGSTMHTQKDFAELASLARSGSIEPLVAAIYPLTEIVEAQQRFLAKDFVGKVVLDPWPGLN